MNTVCINPADTLAIPHLFLWVCVLIGFIAGVIAGHVMGSSDRAKLAQADALLLKVHVAANDPGAWRAPRKLMREVADFLGMP